MNEFRKLNDEHYLIGDNILLLQYPSTDNKNFSIHWVKFTNTLDQVYKYKVLLQEIDVVPSVMVYWVNEKLHDDFIS